MRYCHFLNIAIRCLATLLPCIVALTALALPAPFTPASPDTTIRQAVKEPPMFPGDEFDFHGYTGHVFTVDGCSARVVAPKVPLPGRPWVWRTMFWDAFPGVDIALLNRGFYVAFIDVGNTFGSPDAMTHFDAFYRELTKTYAFSPRPALEGLSRGGLYAYRWAHVNTDKVGCLYGDAPVCDMKSWPGGKGKGSGSPSDWKIAIQSYHFANEGEMLAFKGNPIDILSPLAAARIPILHVYGETDKDVPPAENTEIVRDRYMRLGGEITVIAKQDCAHHPHGLSDPTPVVNFIIAHTTTGAVSRKALDAVPKPGTITVLPKGSW